MPPETLSKRDSRPLMPPRSYPRAPIAGASDNQLTIVRRFGDTFTVTKR
jgi:hypothetical protein